MSPFDNLAAVVLLLSLGLTQAEKDPVLHLADRLLASGLAEEAVTEYKRYIFFNSARSANLNSAVDLTYAYGQIATAYRIDGRMDEAVEMLLRAIPAEPKQDERDHWRIQLGVLEMARGQYDLADFTLLKVEMFSQASSARRRAAFFRGVCNVYMGRVDEAKEAFRAFAANGDPQDRQLHRDLEAFLDRSGLMKPKSARTAKWLSTFVPGAGQMYAGYWKDGVHALVLNAATANVVAGSLAARRYMSAIVDSSFLFFRFYGGNRARAASTADTANKARRRDAVAEILRMVEQR